MIKDYSETRSINNTNCRAKVRGEIRILIGSRHVYCYFDILGSRYLLVVL